MGHSGFGREEKHQRADEPARMGREPRSRAMTARLLAVDVLSLVRGHGELETGKSASDILSQALLASGLSRQDEALATELVYSTLRRRLTLDWIIEKFSGVEPRRIQPWLRDIIRIGVLQLVYMGGVPEYAAVDESVKLARAALGGRAAGFANSVLRKVAAGRSSIPFPSREKGVVEHISVVHSHPRWLVKRWLERMGEEAAEAVCVAGNTPPPITARVNLLRATREKLIAEMADEGAEAVPSEDDQMIEIVSSPKRLSDLRSFQEGLFYLQDVSATIPVRMLAPVEGERVLDLCSAPGGKATHIAELMHNRGMIVACDIDEQKMLLLRENIERLGTSTVRPLLADGAAIRRVLKAQFDRVLVDAPCSNTGVLRRRVEARWRLRESQLKKLQRIQKALLGSACLLVKPGGVLVYSTCSIEQEENQQVVEEFLSQRKDFKLDDEKAFLPRGGGAGGDGGYAAKMVKR